MNPTQTKSIATARTEAVHNAISFLTDAYGRLMSDMSNETLMLLNKLGEVSAELARKEADLRLARDESSTLRSALKAAELLAEELDKSLGDTQKQLTEALKENESLHRDATSLEERLTKNMSDADELSTPAF
jgi:septal ring factor EnvC (AmiA/AmiB activator)